MTDVQIFEQPIEKDGNRIGKISILVGGMSEENPKEFMDKVVNKYVGTTGHNQFIEIHLDNPWTRVVMDCINDIKFRPITDNDKLR
jgi:hypothetical protein